MPTTIFRKMRLTQCCAAISYSSLMETVRAVTKMKPLFLEFLAKKGIDFQMLQKSFPCTYTGLVNMFVVNFVEIDQVVFSPVLQIGIQFVKNKNVSARKLNGNFH